MGDRITVASSSVAGVLHDATHRLADAGCPSPQVDAEILLAHVLGTTRSGLYTVSGRVLADEHERTLDRLVARRERREPLAYVLGEWGFRRLVLGVDPRVLVPRPETEIVVERALALIENVPEPRVLDVGTGSGAVALALADEHPGARVTGMDSSEDALAVAAANARRTGLEIELLHRDLFTGLPAGPWDLVVSNPPYVRADEIDGLEPEVRDWEPRSALVVEGATEAIAVSAQDVLVPGGGLVLEVAEAAARAVEARLRSLRFAGVRVTRDLADRERVVECKRR